MKVQVEFAENCGKRAGNPKPLCVLGQQTVATTELSTDSET